MKISKLSLFFIFLISILTAQDSKITLVKIWKDTCPTNGISSLYSIANRRSIAVVPLASCRLNDLIHTEKFMNSTPENFLALEHNRPCPGMSVDITKFVLYQEMTDFNKKIRGETV